MKMKITSCGKCGLKYPEKMGQCPKCNGAPARKPLSAEEHIARMSDIEVKYIFQSSWWEQGTEKARQLCLAEYDKRFGLENWPAHISKEGN